jgi:polyisoprenoid-binding protein YceI
MAHPEVPTGHWTVDPVHSRLGFVARHMMVSKVRGAFKDFQGDVTIAENPLDSKISFVVQMESIDTGNGDRDGHLRTNDFFDVTQHPTMQFESTSIEGDDGNYEVTGDLTIKGTTKPVTFDVEFEGTGGDPWGGTRAGFSASATINRKDWGIEWNAPLETGGVMLGDKVQIELDIQMVKDSDA